MTTITTIDRARNTRTTTTPDGVTCTAPLLGLGQVSAILRAATLPHGNRADHTSGWHIFRGSIVEHHAPVVVRWLAETDHAPCRLDDCAQALRAAGYVVTPHPTMDDVIAVELR